MKKFSTAQRFIRTDVTSYKIHTLLLELNSNYSGFVFKFCVFPGERPFTEDNHLLGNFGLMDIPLKPRGMLEVEVSFDVDANGILNVTASEKSSGKKEKVKITNEESRLSADEIAKMVENAENFKKDDEIRKKRIEYYIRIFRPYVLF